jgi:hypothetical protein
MGSHRLDHATLEVDLGHPSVQGYVQNLSPSTLVIDTQAGSINVAGTACSIVAINSGARRAVHWGKLTVSELSIGANERITLVSRMEKSHFGRPLGFQWVLDPRSSTLVRSDHDPVFNPEVHHRKKIIGNRRNDVGPVPIFIDPASMETGNAAFFQGVAWAADPSQGALILETSLANWNLIEAVQYLCWDCNRDENEILNPTVSELVTILSGDRTLLKNHILRHGMYLNEALDHLLMPYGYQWNVQYTSETSRKIVLHQNGKGYYRNIGWQAVGETLDLNKQQSDLITLTYDRSQAINQVRATGDFAQLEVTIELKPAWPQSYDTVDLMDLEMHSEEWEAHPEWHRVWRDWVADEAGDYGRAWQDQPAGVANTHISQYFLDVYGTGVPLWQSGHPEVVAKRRKLFPMLTLGQDGKPLGKEGGCHVEWWNKYKEGGADWDALDPEEPLFSCRLLEDEIGIRFTGAVPPFDIADEQGNARVRVTGTIKSDWRISAIADRRNASVNFDVHEQVVDVNTRFHAKQLHQESLYFSDVVGGGRKADLADGRLALADFAEFARASWDQAQCSGPVRLEGLDHMEYNLGDIIRAIVGRNVTLNLTGSQSEDARYPQVFGIRYDVQNQKTTLSINDMKQTDAQVASLVRKTKHLK